MAPGSRLQELTAKYMQNPRRFFVPLANEYRIAGDLDRAIALCREHLPAQPGHMSGHIVLGRAYFEKGDYDAARDIFLTSVALDDENLIALRHLGDIARSRSEVAEARGWYARVLDADPENREIEQLLRSLEPRQTGSEPDATGEDGQIIIPEEPSLLFGLGTPGAGDVPAAASSALADPTPPGLRAILGEESGPAFDSHLVRVPDAPLPPATRPLQTFDLSSLGDALEAGAADAANPAREPETPAEAFGITVEGGGFGFQDLDEIIEPAAAGAVPDTLPPIEEADFSTGVDTPSASPVQPAEADILARPVFGALASLASWRTAQERETPAGVTPQSSRPTPAPTPEVAATADASDLFGEETGDADAAATAPEFVTETMAALYAQQGFTKQALEIYRVLLQRNPGDAVLAGKVQQLRAALETPIPEISLEADADKALEFGDLPADTSDGIGGGSAPEAIDDASPVPSGDDLSAAFDSAWGTTPAEEALTGGDDWFADASLAASGDTFIESGSDMFGFALESFAAIPVPAEPVAGRSAMALASVFGGTATAAADETAADMLTALAEQMVGRLPKEPPTLPVPDILDLPAGVAGDEATGTSPAPLLSFDRFFSGSGAPPRPRVDTPVRASAMTPRDLPSVPAAPSPSLSPTFGGVPVIPPPTQPPVAPTWAGFDKFVPPEPPGATRPTGTGGQATPTGAFWTPAVVPAITGQPSAAPPARPVTPPSTPTESAAPATPAEPEAAPPRRTPPSEFHAWLEGLT